MAKKEDAKKELINKLKDQNLPIVVLDEKWLNLFKENLKTEKIKELENNLKELLKRQGKVNTELKDLKLVKDKITQDVLDTVDDANISDKEKKKKQDTNQRLIMEARQKAEELEDEALDLPRLIREANLKLVMECVDACFRKIDKNKEDITLLTQWIDETRVKLKKRILIRQDKETQNTDMYTYLHDVLGAGVMEVFDEESDKGETS